MGKLPKKHPLLLFRLLLEGIDVCDSRSNKIDVLEAEDVSQKLFGLLLLLCVSHFGILVFGHI
jgi:hypothetical protein